MGKKDQTDATKTADEAPAAAPVKNKGPAAAPAVPNCTVLRDFGPKKTETDWYPYRLVNMGGKQYIIMRNKNSISAFSDLIRNAAARALSDNGIPCESLAKYRAPFLVDERDGSHATTAGRDGTLVASRDIPEEHRVYEIWFEVQTRDLFMGG